jgi:hypothetical protein
VVDDGLEAGVVYGEPAGLDQTCEASLGEIVAVSPYLRAKNPSGVQRQADRPIQNVSLRARGVGC